MPLIQSLRCWSVGVRQLRHPGCKIKQRVICQRNPAQPTQPPLLTAVRYLATRKKAVCLSEEERGTRLSPLLSAQWSMVEGRDAIKKTFLFTNFNEAWGWMNRVALAGEKIDHHPEWFNVYNRVEVTWSTHDCGGLSAKDVRMATFCDDAYKAFKK